MNKHKILFILHDLGGGGAEKVFINIANGFIKKGISVEVLVGRVNVKYPSLLDKKVPITVTGCKNLIDNLWKLPGYIKGKDYTHIFTASDTYSIASIILKNILNLKYKTIATLHYDLPHQISILPRLNQIYMTLTNKYFIANADKIVAVSNGVGLGFEAVVKKNLDNLITIYNPVFDEDIFNSSSEGVDEKLFNNNKTLISIGKLANNPKNQELLIKAFYILCKTENNLQLIFLGEGEDKNKFIELTKELGIAEKVFFLGFKTNPYKYIVKSNLLVSSSNTEGFGNVLVEALALGVNVVSTDCPSGPREILENGKYGFLSPVNDPIKLAETIEKALKWPIDSNILKSYAQTFSSGNIIEKYLKVLG